MDKTSAGYHSGFFQSSKCESSRNRFSAAIEIHAGTARILHPVLQPQAPQGGHLFQGRYKAIVRKKDEYLLGLVRYIHLNLIRANMVRKVDEYPYSGHRSYVEERVSEVLGPARVLDMVGGRAGYRRFVHEGLKDGHREDYYQVEDQRFLGAEKFAEKLKRKANEEEIFLPKKHLSAAFRRAARAVEVGPDVLGGADRGW